MTLLEIEDLDVGYRIAGGHIPAVRGVSLTVDAGETVAIVGESGSGKSTLAQAVIGLLPDNGAVEGGRIALGGEELTGLSAKAFRAVRGRRIGLVPQDPTVSLNPVQRIGPQVAETLRVHGLADRRTARIEAVALLARAGLPEPELRARQYPHELSGGMRQRVLIAIATAANPSLIIADEPTSALDATVQRRILDHLDTLRDAGTALLLVTHDLGVAADRADRLVVMSGGRIVESGPTAQVLADPQQPYTRTLLAAAPGLTVARARPPVPAEKPLVEVRGLTREFRLGRKATLRAVDDVSFTIARGETLGLVGESGSGKSTTARLVLRLDDPTAGEVRFDGTDITRVRGAAWRELRRRAQLIYQNPYASLDPRFTVEEVVTEPLRAFGIGTRATQRQRAAELVGRVALPEAMLARRPVELSGGQRQRIAIARALALSPDLVVCDEPVSALDVSVQAQVLELLEELQTEQGLAYLFISHDLAVVRRIAHRVGVMRQGRLLELRPTEELFTDPHHDYTRELLAAIAGARTGAS
ncbi:MULTISPECIES: ABC transporter ATP-binding protein [Pseudonocardia]|uniref:Peptide/nickel transport system ATP-binding protein n=1 Tax=Pseudonocardia oroxyli TaxID=366584 RepID=A0A1G7EUU9_PSEOR|nr:MULTISPECIES: ABC transporter ATP-binding protein [Pseudonocardia]MCF7548283.1 ABC transporter ATP-binding protein [Pseudonocardia sp. WMMC193]SDE67428.1 peptide/nickel transport system ATP-binding protein [Pseudonocardia oroxyli]